MQQYFISNYINPTYLSKRKISVSSIMTIVSALLHFIFLHIIFRQCFSIDSIKEFRFDTPLVKDVLDAATLGLAILKAGGR